MTTLASERIHAAHILVVGDMILDRYWLGGVDRTSPGAPVPVVQIKRQDECLDGAANVARNVVAPGTQAAMLGVIGDDGPSRSIETLLDESHVTGHLHWDPAVNTTIKLHVLARQQQLIRVDFEGAPMHEVPISVLDRYGTLVSQHDMMVLPDYGKGGLTHVGKVIETSRQTGRHVLVDPEGGDYSRYRGATVITSNRAEMRQVVGSWKSEQDPIIRAQSPRRELQLEALLLTRSGEGTTFYTRHGMLHVSTQVREAFDVSDAGDTIITTLATLLGAGTNVKEAVQYVNRAGGIMVGKLGTVVVVHAELFN